MYCCSLLHAVIGQFKRKSIGRLVFILNQCANHQNIPLLLQQGLLHIESLPFPCYHWSPPLERIHHRCIVFFRVLPIESPEAAILFYLVKTCRTLCYDILSNCMVQVIQMPDDTDPPNHFLSHKADKNSTIVWVSFTCPATLPTMNSISVKSQSSHFYFCSSELT